MSSDFPEGLPPFVGVCARRNYGKDTVANRLSSKYGYSSIAFADELKRFVHDLFAIPTSVLWGDSALRASTLDGAEDPDYWVSVHRRIDKRSDSIRALFGPHCADPIPALHFQCDLLSQLKAKLTVRDVLQQVGTNWGKKLWSELWIYHTYRTISSLQQGGLSYSPEGGAQCDKNSTTMYSRFVLSDVRFPDDEAKSVVARKGLLLWIDASERVKEDNTTREAQHESEPTLYKFKQAQLPITVLDNNGSLDDLKRNIRAVFGTR